MAQLCVRPKGDPMCPFHPKHNVILRCKNCPGNTLVCPTCITSIHEGHKLGDIQEGFTQKVENIKQFITKTETLTIPQLTTKISSIAMKKKTTTELFQSEIRTAREQAEQLKELVDLQMTKTVSSLESEMKDTLESLDTYQHELEQFKSKLEKEMKDTKATITSDNDILLLDTEEDIMKKSDDCIPPSPEISVPHFLPCTDPLPHVQLALGNLEIKKTKAMKKLSDAGTATAGADSSDQYKITPFELKHVHKVDKSNVPQQLQRILVRPIQLTIINRSSFIRSLFLLPNNMACVQDDNSKRIDLINDNGAVQKTLTLNTKVFQICLHPSTGDVYGCCKDKSVRHINMQSKGKIKTKVIFHIDDEPWSIACTSHNVIVGMEKKLCMYTYEGGVVYSMDIGRYSAFYISVCNKTNRVAVACGSYGVLVLDYALQMVYRYKGEGAAAGVVRRERFNTLCAVFDDDGYLLVGDYYNKEVHILDDTAKYMSTIKTKDMANVWTLGTHDGVLWVGCRDPNKIVCVKYTEKPRR